MTNKSSQTNRFERRDQLVQNILFWANQREPLWPFVRVGGAQNTCTAGSTRPHFLRAVYLRTNMFICIHFLANAHTRIRGVFIAYASRIHAYAHSRIHAVCAFLGCMCIHCLQVAGRVYLWHTASTDYRPPDRCAWVTAVAALCFGNGAFGPLPDYCLFASATSVQCLQHVHVVHHLCTVCMNMRVHGYAQTCIHAYQYASSRICAYA